jgi:transcriptional regulator with XRE-family HTH domain
LSRGEYILVAIEYPFNGKMFSIVNTTFNTWLIGELKKRDWSQSDLARESNTARATISNLLNEARNPGVDLLKAIAIALHYPPEFVFRMAGLLPPERKGNPTDDELLHLFDQLNEGDQKEILEWVRFKAEKRKE